MKFFYDTEFLEDGKTIELISIGIVAEDGSEYYAVNRDAPWVRIGRHEWLRQNVLPSLPRYRSEPGRYAVNLNDPIVKTLDQIRADIVLFLRGPAEPWWDIDLWAWYGAYDHVALCQLWGPMIGLPVGMPMWTNDLRQEVHRLGLNPCTLPEQADGHHNALADARHVRALYKHVTTITQPN